MSPPFAHSRKHVIFVTACVIRSFATGSSWAFKITALANGFYKNGVSLCRSASTFARVLRQQICNWKRSLAPRTKMFAPCKINTRLQVAVMTSLRKATLGKRRPVNSVAKHILSKKESVQRGARNVQSAVAEIISQKLAQLRPEKCTTWEMNSPMAAIWST